MTKQEILDKFSDIDFVYNDSSKHETLSRMLDELLKEQEPKQVNDIAQQISCFSGICPNCGKILNTTCNKRYCGDCGQEVKWE